MKRYILYFCFLCAAFSLSAQTRTKWTLRQCIDYALKNNIDIKQQLLNVKRAEINLNTSKYSRLPDLSANVNQSISFGRTQSMATGIYQENKASNTGVGASSSTPLFTGFRISNQIKADKFSLLSATAGLAKAKENLELQVASLYLDVLLKKEILAADQQQVQYSKEQVDKTKLMVDAGKVPESQLFDAKAQLANDELTKTNGKNDLDMSLLNLSQALNFESTDNFDVQEPLQEIVVEKSVSSIIPPADIFAIAMHIKPQIKEAEFNLESSKKMLNVAKSGYYPKLDFGLSYNNGFNHLYNFQNDGILSQLRNNGREMIGLSLNIPIFDRFVTRNQVRSAHIDIISKQLDLANVKLSFYKEIQQAYQSAVAAQANYVSTKKAYDAAKESYHYAIERYNIGKLTSFDLSQAQTKLYTSLSSHIQAKYDFLFRTKILDFYRGIPIDIK